MLAKKYFDKLISAAGILCGVAVMQACSLQLPEQESCGFVRNSQAQRVSWTSNEPMHLYIDNSVPQEWHQAIFTAAEKWNLGAGRTLIEVHANRAVGQSAPARDGYSKIYMMSTWDADRIGEQARTTVHWMGSVLQEADIRINAKDFTFFTDHRDYQSGAIHFESLVLHELGHALGLAHNDSDYSVMQTALAQGRIRDTVGKEDLASLACEYR